MKIGNIDKHIESAINQVLATNPPSLSVGDIREVLLANNVLLRNSNTLDRRIDISLARRFDPVAAFEMEREDFLRGRPENALHGRERDDYIALCRNQAEALLGHESALEAFMGSS